MSPEQRSSIIKAISTGKTESLANAIDEAKTRKTWPSTKAMSLL
jgi:hypothetical protein